MRSTVGPPRESAASASASSGPPLSPGGVPPVSTVLNPGSGSGESALVWGPGQLVDVFDPRHQGNCPGGGKASSGGVHRHNTPDPARGGRLFSRRCPHRFRAGTLSSVKNGYVAGESRLSNSPSFTPLRNPASSVRP